MLKPEQRETRPRARRGPRDVPRAEARRDRRAPTSWSGTIIRDARAPLVRDGVVVYDGRIGSLRRFKDDVREVREGYECGIGIENFQDIKEGDVIEAYEVREVAREL